MRWHGFSMFSRISAAWTTAFECDLGSDAGGSNPSVASDAPRNDDDASDLLTSAGQISSASANPPLSPPWYRDGICMHARARENMKKHSLPAEHWTHQRERDIEIAPAMTMMHARTFSSCCTSFPSAGAGIPSTSGWEQPHIKIVWGKRPRWHSLRD